ncbi:RNA polymerase sigma factor [Pseudofrankia inefficax]|uniref:RNA polymerase, sigma-24 subunit, ECF subfamily n=1 Tax=Pseudofrankia inefficax (strain DSM 45817 / CECT 9037 / DDB 130130 / EuI1c) TaxID=298654 RepID=E3IW07_PSEI1|nr:RNA polymerase sigma factor [Pseudofrankia inefficax]ADP84935.1 RNA polymerase, sigma-24 subunit, ECF subfamily [Pseudofrankia inefficax]
MTDVGSDAALLAAVGAGDLDALRELYDRHAPWLSVRLARRCNDGEVVADALQDTFVAIWRKPAGFHGDGEVAAWIWGIAVRRLVSRLRSRRDVIVVPEPPEPGSVPAAEEQVLVAVEYGDVGQAMARLSPQMRAVIQAVVLDGLTAKEAARLLRVPESTVKTRLSRAKAQLRATLAEGVA